MIKAIAIDDEPIALDIVSMYAEKTPFLNLEAVFVNAFDAIDYLNKNDIDLLFLDIKMPDISGIDFYNSLARKPLLIFTTAYPEHAVTGFELEAIDYLLKPFAFPRFLKACNKAFEITQNKTESPTHIFVKDSFDTVRILLDDIRFVEATGNYVRYILSDREILTRATVRETLELLPGQLFLQVHRSFIVNCNHVEKIERHQLKIATYTIPVSTSYLAEVREKFS
ncbi:MAG TPA: LytTR family DNA-binding domain-containing protein [Sphingobacterium sp.]|nr:LytTR family DNA-binding domain-containing protein [Sphingobacterium sp.]